MFAYSWTIGRLNAIMFMSYASRLSALLAMSAALGLYLGVGLLALTAFY
jgi:hypothetical protein